MIPCFPFESYRALRQRQCKGRVLRRKSGPTADSAPTLRGVQAQQRAATMAPAVPAPSAARTLIAPSSERNSQPAPPVSAGMGSIRTSRTRSNRRLSASVACGTRRTRERTRMRRSASPIARRVHTEGRSARRRIPSLQSTAECRGSPTHRRLRPTDRATQTHRKTIHINPQATPTN